MATLDPTGRITNLPLIEDNERPQVRFSLTEVNHQDIEKIYTSISELDAAKSVIGINPAIALELKQIAEEKRKYLNDIWITKLSLSFNTAYFKPGTGVDVMSLTNFNVLVYPDGRISMEFWLNSEEGNRLLLNVSPDEHHLDHDQLQEYLSTLYTCLTEEKKKKKKK